MAAVRTAVLLLVATTCVALPLVAKEDNFNVFLCPSSCSSCVVPPFGYCRDLPAPARSVLLASRSNAPRFAKEIAVPADSEPMLLRSHVELESLPLPNTTVAHSLGGKFWLVLAPKGEQWFAVERALLDFHKEVLVPFTAARRVPHLLLGKSSGKQAVVDAVKTDTWLSTLDDLSGVTPFKQDGRDVKLTTRYTFSQQNQEAATRIHQLLEGMGYEVEEMEFQVKKQTNVRNIIAVKTGSTHPNEIVVVGAHYDSISQDPTELAPGAVDNGSGASGVVAIAKAIQESKATFGRTVHLVLFGGEEQGMYGSAAYVKHMTSTEASGTVVAALIMDMICFRDKFFGVKLEGTTKAHVRELVSLAADNYHTIAPALSVQRPEISFGSDHVPFQEAGIAAFLAIEEDDTDYHSYHRTTDVAKHCNLEQTLLILQGLTGTLCDVAGLA